MKLLTPLAMAAAAVVALPALADEPPRDKPAEEQSEQPKADEKICKRVALGMESRRKERVCLTAEEWRKLNNPR